ncbi:MAG TPA: peptidase domain-containing ABC transporter, partial [Thermoanaerobaculia bacterium]|nr:peptidase domain-containing ABC transporter [Thermoanaerobaculia bacterium]
MAERAPETVAPRLPALDRLGRLPGRRRRVPFVLQGASSDCGAACLAMVLGLHGRHVRLDEVREAAGVGRDGVDAQALLDAGRRYGLRGRGVRFDGAGELALLGAGAILHWGFRHFVVLDRVTRRGAVVLDPAMGRREVGRRELEEELTGVALLFEPTAELVPSAPPPRGLRRYLRPLSGELPALSRTLALSLLLQLLALGTPLLTGTIVDRVVPRADVGLLGVLAAGLAFVAVFHFLASLVRAHLLLAVRTRLDAGLSVEFLDHLVDLPFLFFQQRSAGDLLARLNSHATVREILTAGVLSGALDGALVTLYLALLALTHGGLCLLVVGLGAAQVAVFVATRRRHRELMSSELRTQAASRTYQVQMLAGIETLKAMGAERRGVERWADLFVDELNAGLARGRLSAVSDSLLASLTLASPFLVLTYGAAQVLDGELTLGTMLAASALAVGFLAPLSALVATGFRVQLLGSYAERIDDVLETPKEEDPAAVAPAPPLSGRIRVEAVSFRYAPSAPLAVRDVTLDIAPGSFVALVGPSGAGKTTLAHLLAGLYRPSAGRILYDGHDLAALDLRSLRRQLGVVTQQPYLFGASIRHNLTLGDPELPLSRVVEAARRAAIHDEVLALPMQYDTLLADGGASLSGGQRQRLALARALVHRPAILLLDEATSSLDAATERAIQEELTASRATRIVIAHRLSTVAAADLVVVMRRGEVVERGRHEELLAAGG